MGSVKSALVLLLAIVLVGIASVGATASSCGGVGINQKLVGSFQDTPQYRVDITDETCDKHCHPAHVVLSCKFFNTTTLPDPAVIEPLGNGDFLINNGRPIFHGVSFNYTTGAGENKLTLKSWFRSCLLVD